MISSLTDVESSLVIQFDREIRSVVSADNHVQDNSTDTGHVLSMASAQLDELSRLIKYCSNKRRPIIKLPPECICAVVTAMELPRWRYHSVASNSLGWIVLSHVCSRLREIIVGSRYLWARCAFALNPRACPEIIERAGKVPLHVRVNGSVSADVAYLARCHLLNAATISLDSSALQQKISGCIWPFTARDARNITFPSLRELSLWFSHRDEVTADDFLQPPAISPMLRSVTFRRIYIPVALENLEVFRLILTTRDATPTAAVFLDLMRRLSNVRSMTLIRCLPRDPWHSDPRKNLSFSRLEELQVQDQHSRVYTFCRQSEIPKSARVKLDNLGDWQRTMKQENDEDGEEFAFLSYAKDRLKGPLDLGVRTLGIQPHGMKGGLRIFFAVSSPHRTRQVIADAVSPDEDLVLEITVDGYQTRILDIIAHIKRDCSLPLLTALEIGTSTPFPVQQWNHSLADYGGVDTLLISAIGSCTQKQLWEAIGTTTVTAGSGERHAILPLLRHIIVDDYLHTVITPPRIELLLWAIEQRHKSEAGIKSLTLFHALKTLALSIQVRNIPVPDVSFKESSCDLHLWRAYPLVDTT